MNNKAISKNNPMNIYAKITNHNALTAKPTMSLGK